MKTATLTAPQQTQAASNKAAVAAARAALTVALHTECNYLRTAASAPANSRVQLSDDGTTVIIG